MTYKNDCFARDLDDVTKSKESKAVCQRVSDLLKTPILELQCK